MSYEINDESGSSYEWWKKLGSPEYLTPETMQFLYEKSKMQKKTKILFRKKDSKEYSFNETINPGDVKLIQISNI